MSVLHDRLGWSAARTLPASPAGAGGGNGL